MANKVMPVNRFPLCGGETEDMQKIVDANEKLVKEVKNG
jgi:hypothetical protein